MQRVCILGGGSFGTAISDLLARQGYDVHLWVRDASVAHHMQQHRRNPRYLSEFTLHENILPTSDLRAALTQAEWVVSTLPSHALRPILEETAPWFPNVPLVLGSKGIESNTLFTCAEIAADVLGHHWENQILALSGPSFAREIMLQHPTAVVLACTDESLAHHIGKAFFCDSFRAYSSTDVVGVEMGGALKNVMAIAAGAISGMGFGDNTRAALITRGIAETSRLAAAKGGKPLTLAGLAGVGDMVLTCTGALSRNRAVGQALGEGKSVEEAIRSVRQVVEGVQTAKSAMQLADRLKVDAPITHAVYSVLYEGWSVRQAIMDLVRREPGRE